MWYKKNPKQITNPKMNAVIKSMASLKVFADIREDDRAEGRNSGGLT